MKTQIIRTKPMVIVIALVALAALWAAWGATGARAIIVVGGKFGMVGIAPGQTAQLNVVNTHPPDPQTPVEVEMLIVDGDGNVLARKMARLLGQQSAFLSVNRDLIPPDPQREKRVMLRGLVKFIPPDPQMPDGGIISSFEVYDNRSGKTSVYDPGIFGFNPQPEPPAQ